MSSSQPQAETSALPVTVVQPRLMITRIFQWHGNKETIFSLRECAGISSIQYVFQRMLWHVISCLITRWIYGYIRFNRISGKPDVFPRMLWHGECNRWKYSYR